MKGLMKDFIRHGIISVWETRKPGGLPSFGGATLQSLERRALLMYITYSDFIQTGIFICALVRLCHTIFKDSKQRVACRLFAHERYAEHKLLLRELRILAELFLHSVFKVISDRSQGIVPGWGRGGFPHCFSVSAANPWVIPLLFFSPPA